ncbi:MAG: sulfotransferase [Novosphingobium sp.]|uniref:tetratricopeptide repeat-containing sulfotransferase family protein n=1 Tax=Novosphingobium sp. TaxID=1874826 RepID=UPI002637DF8F|nr:sulfotransferase family protein [Novosphingobium sp.]MCP5387485.1 sulfotransferase [Novosphingobium sp.]
MSRPGPILPGAIAQQPGKDPRQLFAIGKAQIGAGKLDEAIGTLELATRLMPQDPVGWDLLGFCHARRGEYKKSLSAHEKAINLSPRPPQAGLYINLASSMQLLNRHDVAERALRDAIAFHPHDPVIVRKFTAAAGQRGRLEDAIPVLKGALAAHPRHPALLLELGMAYDRLSMMEEYDALVEEIGDPGEVPQFNMLKAWYLRRHNRLDEAGALMAKCGGGMTWSNAIVLRAELAARAGHFDEAIEHYKTMNRALLAGIASNDTESYRNRVAAATAAMKPPPGPPVPFAGRLPAFVVGSPRSGTTLLDTLLGGHPDVVVAEERLMRSQIEIEFPGLEQSSDPRRIEAARRRYFELAETIVGPLNGRLLVDKHPLHMATMPLLDRLFPRAPVILVERHPCAAVFSCFSTPFAPNMAMRSYATLEGSARTYDALFANWTCARELLPLNVHEIRYERMIVETQTELRALLDFLGLEWTDAVLDHQASAAKRGQVNTASYAQIHQPLHTNAKERWRKFAAHMEPVMPILRPWIDRMGYEP